MKYIFALLVLIIILFKARAQDEGEILNFTQSPVTVGPHGKMNFYCEGSGAYANWRVNGLTFDNHTTNPNYNMVVGYGIFPVTPSRYYLFLTIKATPYNNGTNITCNVYGARQNKQFIIADSPSKPDPCIMYNASNGKLLVSVTWDEPFTHPGFSVNYYTLQKINNSYSSPPLNMSLGRIYTEKVNKLPISCYELEYIVTTYNDIGNSSGSVRRGVPIYITPVNVQWTILYQLNGDPHLKIWWKPSNSCSYQEVNYTVYLVHKASGASIELNSSNHLYSVHSGLTSGASYTVVVEARSIAGVTVTRQEVDINKQYFHNDYNQKISILTACCGTFGGLAVILFGLIMILVCQFCKNRKLLKKHRTLRTFSETVTASGVGAQRPTSLQPKCATTNPIYEGGPLYESPNGEPLRGLLGSTLSTPNTPLDSPRYIFDAFPPNLPPPRKSSTISLLYDSPDASPTTGEVKKIERSSEKPVLKTGEDEYTVMRPASVRQKRAPKPSPLVILGLSSLPEN